LPLAIVTLTLCRNAYSLQELRLLLAGVLARAASRLLLLTQPVEKRLDNGRVELDPNSAEVVKAMATKVSRGFIVATGPS
jgi:hypothetical protein